MRARSLSIVPLLLVAACGPKAAPVEAKEAAPEQQDAPKSKAAPTKAGSGMRLYAGGGVGGTPGPGGLEGKMVIADFEKLCAALNHDYIDGTLTDYYKDVKPRTVVGAKARKEGEAADKPGRALAASIQAFLGSGVAPGEDMPECRKLLDELDDLE